MAFPSGSFPNTRGANNPRSKLTEAQALHIRHCYKNGVCHKSLAAMFGVSPSTVRNIGSNHYWTFVKRTTIKGQS